VIDKQLIATDLLNLCIIDENNTGDINDWVCCQAHEESTDAVPLTAEQISQIETEYATQLADYNAKQYQRDRQYPSIGEQLDMQYWDAVNGTTTWKDAIAQVKADNPKPQE